MAVLEEYTWLFVVGVFVAFGFGWGTGANDVANAFGTSVGSRTLTLRQAVALAAVFELCGALLLGRVSTTTIALGIADIHAFTREPEVYAYGMVCALAVGTVWLTFTSWCGLNVSSTHTIVGGIVGFALVWDGPKAVNWSVKNTQNSFPPYKGVLPIIISCSIAPVLTAITAATIFVIVRSAVLRRRNAFALSFWTLPPFVLATTWINIYFVFTKGAKKTLRAHNEWSATKAAWISCITAVCFTLICIFVALPLLRRKVALCFDENGRPITTPAQEAANSAATEMEKGGIPPLPTVQETWWQKTSKVATHGMDVNIHEIVKTDEQVLAIHENAELFEPRVEYAFRYLQVFSAICVIFAHGAGEVGYMAGPLTTIWNVYHNGSLAATVTPPIWIVILCAISLVIGLATYGYNVTRAMGVKLAKLTPTRGFAAELGTAFVIMFAAQYGLPTSSSQCITGAIIGVGLLEGSEGVNWRQFLKQFTSWVSTLVVSGLLVAAVFSQGVYAPSKVGGKDVNHYEDRVLNTTTQIYNDFSVNLMSYKAASDAGLLVNLQPAEWAKLNASVTAIANIANTMNDPNNLQRPNVDAVIGSLYQSLSLLQQYSIFTLGQDFVFPGNPVCIDPSATNQTRTARTRNFPCRSPQFLPSTEVTTFP